MSLTDLLDLWRTEPTIARNIAAWRTRPARAAQTTPLPAELHPTLVEALRRRGIERLYSHQAEAWAHVQAGRHPVVVTGTASGKTLAYNLPVLHARLIDPASRALYLFPTKALAHDQLTIVNEQWAVGALAATYDGDTPAKLRPTVRAKAAIVLTNPDMLHTAILPHHPKWADFFRHLRFVVIDEMHSYRGVFGSHVANVLRRLKRVARFYGASPQFILTSATIANPGPLAESLIEAPVAVVDVDGSARGPKHFIIYNPPVVNPDLGLRRSAVQESIRLTSELLHHHVQAIIFARTRRTVEILLTYLQHNQLSMTTNQLSKGEETGVQKRSFWDLPAPAESSPTGGAAAVKSPHPNPLPEGEGTTDSPPSPFGRGVGGEGAIRAYRSGYLPRQRREIEQGLRSGRVQAVVATSALELGIDIGGLGAAVLTGYPGTIAGTWQQAGRAGRQQDESLAVLVASAGPLDQFLAHHPAWFFERSPEAARLNPDNLLILLQHLRCAAFELPFMAGDAFGGVEPETLAEFLHFLMDSGDLYRSGPRYFWMADKYPAEQVSLRSASPQNVRLLTGGEDAWRTIGVVDWPSAPWMVHPQAIYLHEGQSYRVDELDLAQGLARLSPSQVDYYTEPKQSTTVQLLDLHDEAAVRGGRKHHGDIQVTTQVTGYTMIQWFTHERLGHGEVSLPPTELTTTGYWLVPSPETVAALREQGLWSNDPNDYGPNWAAQRQAARARDGYLNGL